MEKSQIAFIIDNFSIRAGFIKQVVEKANYFSKQGYDVTVFCSLYDERNCFPEIPKRFKVKSLNYKTISKLTLPIENRIIKKVLMERLIASASIEYEIFIIHGDPYYMLSKFLSKKFNKSKVIWHVNDLPFSFDIFLRENSKSSYKIFGYLLSLVDRYYISFFKNVTTLNNENRKYIKELFGLNSDVVYTGVDAYFKQNKPKIKDKKDWNILSVGAFATNRRYEDIVNAIYFLNNENSGKHYQLTIIGTPDSSPSYFKYLLNLVIRLKIKNDVIFLGSVTNKILKDGYSKADIFVQATDHIGWTIPAMEAMISDTPSIITNTCGLNECLKDGENVIIVSPRKPKSIAEEIRYITSNLEKFEDLKIRGKKYILENFMWDKYCERYKNYIGGLYEK